MILPDCQLTLMLSMSRWSMHVHIIMIALLMLTCSSSPGCMVEKGHCCSCRSFEWWCQRWTRELWHSNSVVYHCALAKSRKPFCSCCCLMQNQSTSLSYTSYNEKSGLFNGGILLYKWLCKLPSSNIFSATINNWIWHHVMDGPVQKRHYTMVSIFWSKPEKPTWTFPEHTQGRRTVNF